jgi:hypothetical protein
VLGRPRYRRNQVTRSISDMAPVSKNPKAEKKVTRYTYDDIKEPRTPETGHTSLLPAEEQVVTLPMDNGWSKAIDVGKLPEGDARPVVVDMDPAADPVLFWAGKRNRREVPVLPLQRNEIVSESRIAQIIERASRAAEEKSGTARQGHLFADLEKTLRETDRGKRVELSEPTGSASLLVRKTPFPPISSHSRPHATRSGRSSKRSGALAREQRFAGAR